MPDPAPPVRVDDLLADLLGYVRTELVGDPHEEALVERLHALARAIRANDDQVRAGVLDFVGKAQAFEERTGWLLTALAQKVAQHDERVRSAVTALVGEAEEQVERASLGLPVDLQALETYARATRSVLAPPPPSSLPRGHAPDVSGEAGRLNVDRAQVAALGGAR